MYNYPNVIALVNTLRHTMPDAASVQHAANAAPG
jgi:hypothetical protein